MLVNVPGENRRTRRTRCDGWLQTRSMNCALCRGCFSTTCPRTCTKSSPPFWTSKRLRSRIMSSSSCDHETTGLCLDTSTDRVEVKPYFNSVTQSQQRATSSQQCRKKCKKTEKSVHCSTLLDILKPKDNISHTFCCFVNKMPNYFFKLTLLWYSIKVKIYLQLL